MSFNAKKPVLIEDIPKFIVPLRWVTAYDETRFSELCTTDFLYRQTPRQEFLSTTLDVLEEDVALGSLGIAVKRLNCNPARVSFWHPVVKGQLPSRSSRWHPAGDFQRFAREFDAISQKVLPQALHDKGLVVAEIANAVAYYLNARLVKV